MNLSIFRKVSHLLHLNNKASDLLQNHEPWVLASFRELGWKVTKVQCFKNWENPIQTPLLDNGHNFNQSNDFNNSFLGPYLFPKWPMYNARDPWCIDLMATCLLVQELPWTPFILNRSLFYHLISHPGLHRSRWTSQLEQITENIEKMTAFHQARHKKPILVSNHWLQMLQVSGWVSLCKSHQLYHWPNQLDTEQAQWQGTELEDGNRIKIKC